MVSTVLSFATLGINAIPVKVEVDASRGLPATVIVGLPDSAVKESKERVRAAITNSGYPFPAKRIIVNLAPADVRKEGTLYDLPIALGILGSSGGGVRVGYIRRTLTIITSEHMITYTNPVSWYKSVRGAGGDPNPCLPERLPFNI